MCFLSYHRPRSPSSAIASPTCKLSPLQLILVCMFISCSKPEEKFKISIPFPGELPQPPKLPAWCLKEIKFSFWNYFGNEGMFSIFQEELENMLYWVLSQSMSSSLLCISFGYRTGCLLTLFCPSWVTSIACAPCSELVVQCYHSRTDFLRGSFVIVAQTY